MITPKMVVTIRVAIVRMGVPSQEVDDLLQIILLRIVQRADSIHDPSEAGIVAFARGCIPNLMLEVYRKARSVGMRSREVLVRP